MIPTFRLVVLGADYAGTPGSAPKANALEFLRTHASATDLRQNQNVLLVVIPSAAGLIQAEQAIASWMAWGEIKNSDAFKDLEPEQKETVKRRERESQKDALTFVKNAFELVIYVDNAGNAQQKKFTMGSEALVPDAGAGKGPAHLPREDQSGDASARWALQQMAGERSEHQGEGPVRGVWAISRHAEAGQSAGGDQHDRGSGAARASWRCGICRRVVARSGSGTVRSRGLWTGRTTRKCGCRRRPR